jgi:hypothetical protein
MGMLTDLYVASPSSARGYDKAHGGSFEREELGGLTNLEFETLWAILSDEEWDAGRHALEEVASTESSWTFQFPPEYSARLRALDDEALARVAARWAETEEISGSAEDVLPVIQALVRLAHLVVPEKTALFVWTSL